MSTSVRATEVTGMPSQWDLSSGCSRRDSCVITPGTRRLSGAVTSGVGSLPLTSMSR
jgi:hypothetical protein